jgi:hypothetical protein
VHLRVALGIELGTVAKVGDLLRPGTVLLHRAVQHMDGDIVKCLHVLLLLSGDFGLSSMLLLSDVFDTLRGARVDL